MTPAATHLSVIVTHWDDLTDTLDAATGTTWPPVMGISYLTALDQHDADDIARQRLLERSPDQLGETPAPLRLDILDTMRAVEAALVHCADITASSVQRPASSLRSAGRDDELGLQLALLAARDGADPRRWRYRGTRTAPYAAAWLAGRLAGDPGPFRPLSVEYAELIANVAQTAAERVLRALGGVRQERAIDRPCPHCRGHLRLDGGDGQPPTVACADCGRTYRLPAAA